MAESQISPAYGALILVGLAEVWVGMLEGFLVGLARRAGRNFRCMFWPTGLGWAWVPWLGLMQPRRVAYPAGPTDLGETLQESKAAMNRRHFKREAASIRLAVFRTARRAIPT